MPRKNDRHSYDVRKNSFFALRTAKKKALVKIAGGKCKKCGETRIWVLDFHHDDPSKKENMISKLMNSNFPKAKEEAAKCDLLCSNCHRDFHFNHEMYDEQLNDIDGKVEVLLKDGTTKRSYKQFNFSKEDLQKELDEKISYREIAKKHGTSCRTIRREVMRLGLKS